MQDSSIPSVTQVVCRSSYMYADRPVAILFDKVRIEVSNIITQRRKPEGIEFHVLLEDGRSFSLTYVESDNSWEVSEM